MLPQASSWLSNRRSNVICLHGTNLNVTCYNTGGHPKTCSSAAALLSTHTQSCLCPSTQLGQGCQHPHAQDADVHAQRLFSTHTHTPSLHCCTTHLFFMQSARASNSLTAPVLLNKTCTNNLPSTTLPGGFCPGWACSWDCQGPIASGQAAPDQRPDAVACFFLFFLVFLNQVRVRPRARPLCNQPKAMHLLLSIPSG